MKTQVQISEKQVRERVLHTWPLNYVGKNVKAMTAGGNAITKILKDLGLAKQVEMLDDASVIVDAIQNDGHMLVCGHTYLYWSAYSREEGERLKFPWMRDY